MRRLTAETPRVLPGSLITLRRKCGKAACHCATGALHETPALSYSEAGRTKMLTLRPDEVAAVAQAVRRYRSAVGALEAEAKESLQALRERLPTERAEQAGGTAAAAQASRSPRRAKQATPKTTGSR